MDENKIAVEVTINETPKVEPTYSWWVIWRDKPNGEFKVLSFNDPETADTNATRIGLELPGREVFVSHLEYALLSVIEVRLMTAEK